MLGLNNKLRALEAEGKPIRVGVVGAGQMGTGMVSQIRTMRGMRAAGIADVDVERAIKAYEYAGYARADIVVAADPRQAEDAIRAQKPVAAEDAAVLCAAEGIDAVIEATGVPEVGAVVAFRAIHSGKHVVMLNVETDVTVGLILKTMAERAGVVYTVSAGDEPGAIKELYDFADSLGFEVVAAGKGKNNPVDLDANPAVLAESARAQGVNPKMLTSFVDGTKTMVEMTAVANAVGFTPDVPGMHGPNATVAELPSVFSLVEQGGILSRKGVVDYALGVAPGVFVVVTSQLEKVREELAYLKMGPGPNYVFYRPYHLTSLETPLSAARAAIYREPTIVPAYHTAETAAVAKKDLPAGSSLDGIGAYTLRGFIVPAAEAKAKKYVPLGLINHRTRVTRDIRLGEILTYDDVVIDETLVIVQLRRLQDSLIDVSSPTT